MPRPPHAPRPRVVIVGAGFAGLELAKRLKRSPVDITLVDKRNHHLFQPLLYQVATASLSPADIAWPIRHVLARQANARVLLGEAVRVDTARRVVVLTDGELAYDILALCCGVSHSYFAHLEWAALAPGLKTIDDAIEIRRRFLLAFEAAEREADPVARRAQLTFVIVGGGPTGVELAGAMAEIARRAIPADFRSIDTTTARIVLVEGDTRLLSAMPADLSERAKRDLEALGVEVILGKQVSAIDGRGVGFDSEFPSRIDARCVFWAAGVAAERPLTASLGVELDKAGRVRVDPDLTVPGHGDIFVLGDLAVVADPATGRSVPGVAPAAAQMGRYAARVIDGWSGSPSRTCGAECRTTHQPFRYRDKGLLATIGRARAVAAIGKLHMGGLAAWLLWALVHVLNLINARSRLVVMYQWVWEYLFFQRGARLITGPGDPRRPTG